MWGSWQGNQSTPTAARSSIRVWDTASMATSKVWKRLNHYLQCARVAAHEHNGKVTIWLSTSSPGYFIGYVCTLTKCAGAGSQADKAGEACLVFRLCAKLLEQSVPIQLVRHSVCHLAIDVGASSRWTPDFALFTGIAKCSSGMND